MFDSYTIKRTAQPKAVINKKISKTNSISPKELTKSLRGGVTCDNVVRDIWLERNVVGFSLIGGLERKGNVMFSSIDVIYGVISIYLNREAELNAYISYHINQQIRFLIFEEIFTYINKTYTQHFIQNLKN
ncbi:Hypothetical_protein [Hexamita inflata]|uniref:Hypothetical_protein n=1 Tax=Hexamita inflata TaxID=28002 RepID=A0AA86Q7E3_9EUKA|nr:Hypothetical protein HINF_LOCUS35137 [Hexamita inflata]